MASALQITRGQGDTSRLMHERLCGAGKTPKIGYIDNTPSLAA
jgi:hypothetical protein